jgi:hypothetical protein
MYLPYRGCFTSRETSTRRVLFILSLVTSPISVRRGFRRGAWGAGEASATVHLLHIPLTLELPFPLYRQNPGDIALNLANLAWSFQTIGGGLKSEVEKVFFQLFQTEG